MFLPFQVLVSLSADSLETETLSYLVEGPISPTVAELGFSLMAGVRSLQYFTTGALHGFTAGAGAPGASCCSMWLVPKGILFPAGMQLGQCFELCSKVLFFWLTSVLSLDANSFLGTKNNLMVVVLYLIYFELSEHVKRMYGSGLLVKVIGQTGCEAQGEIFRKETGAKF